MKSGSRGEVGHLVNLLGGRVTVGQLGDEGYVIRHGFRDGLAAEEMWGHVANARAGFAQVAMDCSDASRRLRGLLARKGFNVLGRAMRAERPGVVFARAAAIGEVDALGDVDSRLFLGLGW